MTEQCPESITLYGWPTQMTFRCDSPADHARVFVRYDDAGELDDNFYDHYDARHDVGWNVDG